MQYDVESCGSVGPASCKLRVICHTKVNAIVRGGSIALCGGDRQFFYVRIAGRCGDKIPVCTATDLEAFSDPSERRSSYTVY